jgi:hypothetical protein
MPTYFSYNALVSQRASGYQNTQFALAELIDNSFDANAGRVKVICFEKRDNNGRRSIDEILVCDDGDGMTSNALQECLQFGNTSNTDLDAMVAQKKKGKFGFGLPNASLSQCTSIQVFSWQDSGDVRRATLDLEELAANQSIEIPPIDTVDLPKHYRSVKAALSEKSGTIVSWRKCDRLSYNKGETICLKSLPLLGSLYRYLLSEGKAVTLEIYEHNPGQNTFHQRQRFQIVPNDPLFLMENTLLAPELFKAANAGREYSESYKPFSVNEKSCHSTSVRLQDNCYPFQFRWKGRIFNFEITTTYARVEIQKPGIREGAKTPVGEFYGRRDSISFVRANREIATGTFGFYRKTEPQHRWWAIEVKFDADADDLLGVHNNKQGIRFSYTEADELRDEFQEFTATLPEAREELWLKLTKAIDRAYQEVWKQVRNQGKDWDLNHQEKPSEEEPGLPGATKTTDEATKTTDGVRPNQFTDEQLRLLQARLIEKYPAIEVSQIERSIKRYDESRVRGCLLYHASEDQALWSMTEVYGFLIILINTNHPFFTNVLAPLRNVQSESALSALELFVSSLAWEERSEHFLLPERRNVLEEFRAYVGIHLNRYIRENSISLESSELVLAPARESD